MVYKENSVYKQGLNLEELKKNIVWENVTNKVTAGPQLYYPNNKPVVRVCRTLKLMSISIGVPLKSPVPSAYTSTYNLCNFDFDFSFNAVEIAGVNLVTGKSTFWALIENQGIKLKIVAGDSFTDGYNILVNPLILQIN